MRELRNVIERLMIMVPGDVDRAPRDLAFLELAGRRPVRAGAGRSAPLFEARDAWERDYILGALAAFDGNISRTADALGLERSNLYRKMRGLGIRVREEGRRRRRRRSMIDGLSSLSDQPDHRSPMIAACSPGSDRP